MNVRAIRKRANLTQVELAEKLGCSRRSVSAWELCKCEPDPQYYKKLLKLSDETEEKSRIPDLEKRLIKTLYNARELIYAGRLDVRDVLDIVYEYVSYENNEKILIKWENLGFYHVRDTISCGELLWDLLPKAYQKILKD